MEELRAVSRPEPIAALNRIREIECGEPLVDVRTFCPQVRIGRRCVPFLRKTVAEMVNQAQALLPPGYRLSVRTCLRSLEIQRSLFDNYFEKLQKEHPDWSYASLRRQTCRYFAPYDQKAPPGHCTGAAVDVHLLLPTGKRADLTSPLSGWRAAHSRARGLSARAMANRAILYRAMIGVGFSLCHEEFWHYSYGDAGWAVRVGETHCFYGKMDIPKTWTGRRK